jgi:hypothetical protein
MTQHFKGPNERKGMSQVRGIFDDPKKNYSSSKFEIFKISLINSLNNENRDFSFKNG